MAATNATKRIWLTFELALLFFVVPAGFWIGADHGVPLPVLPLLVLGTVVAAAVLVHHPALRTDRLRPSETRAELGRIGRLFLIGVVALTAWTTVDEPSALLSLPLDRPDRWVVMIAVYLVFSVVPQELFFRVFFFTRYAPIVRSFEARILLSALSFGFVHVIYGSWQAVALATAGGVLFGWTWVRTRSLTLICIEHAIHGCFVFTVGLHRHFFSGYM